MLSALSIKNYALIDDITVSFAGGFTTITGETGAGKSILLGGLSLVLGKRADLTSLRDKEKKCIIEAEFELEKYKLQEFFHFNDLEYDARTIIRREIYPSGKSRAFINDSPVTLDLLSQLGQQLVDVHSQHQTLRLTEQHFQLHVIDALAGNSELLEHYRILLTEFRQRKKELALLLEQQQSIVRDHDYNSFLLKELDSANLKEGMLEELEEEHEKLSHVETILEQLSSAHQMMNDEQIGLLTVLSQIKQSTSRIATYGKKYQNIYQRLESSLIEMDDISSELQALQEGLEVNPLLLGEIGDKMQQLYDLQKKHAASGIVELIRIREELAEKVHLTENMDSIIEEKEKAVFDAEQKLLEVCSGISNRRDGVLPNFKQTLENKLKSLGMPNASFEMRIIPDQEFTEFGNDNLMFLFSANKGTDFGNLKKVASGGELSRIMLVIKSILAEFEQLPTLMFDEIDSGVSGEISNKMADIMLEMSRNMQVFAITHLPQVASKGQQHFKVYKTEEDVKTNTRIKLLDTGERVVELAEMLGGKSVSDSALAHAKQLLN